MSKTEVDLPNGVLLIDGIGGPVVAWFAKWEEADAFGEEWYFGRRLYWERCKPPEYIPLTPEELAECKRRAAELAANLKVE